MTVISVSQVVFSRLSMSKLEPSFTTQHNRSHFLQESDLQKSVRPEITCQQIAQKHLRAAKDYHACFQADQNISYLRRISFSVSCVVRFQVNHGI